VVIRLGPLASARLAVIELVGSAEPATGIKSGADESWLSRSPVEDLRARPLVRCLGSHRMDQVFGDLTLTNDRRRRQLVLGWERASPGLAPLF
jgi:hypothetical protein